MNMFEEARSIAGMMQICGGTQSELAARLGVSPSYVANKLRLLQMPPSMQEKIVEAGLSERHARALLRLKNHARAEEAFCRIRDEKLSVADTEAFVDRLCKGEEERIPTSLSEFRVALAKSMSSLRAAGFGVQCENARIGNCFLVTVAVTCSENGKEVEGTE